MLSLRPVDGTEIATAGKAHEPANKRMTNTHMGTEGPQHREHNKSTLK